MVPIANPETAGVLLQIATAIARERHLMHRPFKSTTVVALPVQANSIAEGVINLVQTEGYDVVVLGASREGLLQQAIQGNIPEAIASGVESTVILVRGAIQK